MSIILVVTVPFVDYQSFRLSQVQLPKSPLGVYSSPDGTCLFAAYANQNSISLQAYHWSSFGHSEGTILELPHFPTSFNVMTSIGSRSNPYYVGVDHTRGVCKSFSINVTCKTPEYSFIERSGGFSKKIASQPTLNNSLLDCHAEVWTRFPVVPAIGRSTSHTIEGDACRTLSFVSSSDPSLYEIYFKRLILNFEAITKKPTDQELSKLVIRGLSYDVFQTVQAESISFYRCGQWLVNLLCLIPIHIAVAQDNRFIPLKDGVWSREFEESLLGARVEQIVDSLSFGWYESIFKSYLGYKVFHCVCVIRYDIETLISRFVLFLRWVCSVRVSFPGRL